VTTGRRCRRRMRGAPALMAPFGACKPAPHPALSRHPGSRPGQALLPARAGRREASVSP